MSARPATPARPSRVVLAVTAAAIGSVAVAGQSLAATPTNTPTATAAVTTTSASDLGLFGVQDPTYDGVYRQSLALIALTTAGQTPDSRAVTWLLSQQCADGAFTAYRSDPTVACTAAHEDENATAMAIQAMVALGKPTDTAIAALKRFQLADGGFYDNSAFGTPASDANSTGLALSAFAAAGVGATSVTNNGKDADDYLRSIQLPCSATKGAGGYDFQPEATLVTNDYATVQATLGQLGKALPVAASAVAAATPTCAAASDAPSSATNAIAYLADRLAATNGAIPSGFGTGTDETSSADAVLDLVAAGRGSAAVTAGVDALAANAKTYAQTNGSFAPGPLATLVLVAKATGGDVATFGGLNLASTLVATERTSIAPAPAPSPVATPIAQLSPVATSAPRLPMTGSRGIVPLTALGGGLLLLGSGVIFSARRRKQAASAGGANA